MPLIATRGAASAQGFGEFAQTTAPVYIENVFSTYLTVGNGTTTTITNDIDLSGKGGLVWLKDRTGAGYHSLGDTERSGKRLFSNTTDAETSNYPFSFTSSGFTANGNLLDSGRNFVSWTFRKQPKFFDIVTYTGNGNNNRAISHNLGSAPGCVIIKSTSNAQNWPVFHRSTGANTIFWLNATNANTSNTGYFPTAPDSTSFYVGTDTDVNQNGYTYVAYLFAHDAGGFGTSGSDNVISCGSYTGNGSTSGPTVTLGYEPQWLMIKTSTTTGSWQMIDNMRGMIVSGDDQRLIANSSSAELTNNYLSPTATGFQLVSTSSEVNGNGQTYIYIAIRRGPMKTPTSGTSVFYPLTRTGDATAQVVTGGSFPTDLAIYQNRPQSLDAGHYFQDRLRGGSTLTTNTTGAEYSYAQAPKFDVQSGVSVSGGNYTPNFSTTYVYYYLGRAPGFFDVVCYTGDGTLNRQVNHNLTVTPELIIAKRRSGAQSWAVFGSVISTNNYLILDSTGALNSLGATTVYASTSTTFGAQAFLSYNDSAVTYVAYLFATVSGVSKVGSYTGTGALQTVNCGFTGGARFVLIKRTDSTGDWWVYDSARGISSGNDPYLFLNSTAAEVTGTNYVDTTSVGFQVTAAAPAGLNANGGTYIFLAIA